MRIAFLGQGRVARALGPELERAGHEVRFGGRGVAVEGTASLADAAAFGEVVVMAINPWTEIEGVLRQLPSAALAGKVLVDLSNDIVFSGRPALSVPGEPLAQRIQRWAPRARVVKTLNFIPAHLMVRPADQGLEPAVMWVAGDDAAAKQTATRLLVDLGWDEVVDLGPLGRSRLQEAFALMVTRVVASVTNQA